MPTEICAALVHKAENITGKQKIRVLKMQLKDDVSPNNIIFNGFCLIV